jgi:hypothetical protein
MRRHQLRARRDDLSPTRLAFPTPQFEIRDPKCLHSLRMIIVRSEIGRHRNQNRLVDATSPLLDIGRIKWRW